MATHGSAFPAHSIHCNAQVMHIGRCTVKGCKGPSLLHILRWYQLYASELLAKCLNDAVTSSIGVTAPSSKVCTQPSAHVAVARASKYASARELVWRGGQVTWVAQEMTFFAGLFWFRASHVRFWLASRAQDELDRAVSNVVASIARMVSCQDEACACGCHTCNANCANAKPPKDGRHWVALSCLLPGSGAAMLVKHVDGRVKAMLDARMDIDKRRAQLQAAGGAAAGTEVMTLEQLTTQADMETLSRAVRSAIERSGATLALAAQAQTDAAAGVEPPPLLIPMDDGELALMARPGQGTLAVAGPSVVTNPAGCAAGLLEAVSRSVARADVAEALGPKKHKARPTFLVGTEPDSDDEDAGEVDDENADIGHWVNGVDAMGSMPFGLGVLCAFAKWASERQHLTLALGDRVRRATAQPEDVQVLRRYISTFYGVDPQNNCCVATKRAEMLAKFAIEAFAQGVAGRGDIPAFGGATELLSRNPNWEAHVRGWRVACLVPNRAFHFGISLVSLDPRTAAQLGSLIRPGGSPEMQSWLCVYMDENGAPNAFIATLVSIVSRASFTLLHGLEDTMYGPPSRAYKAVFRERPLVSSFEFVLLYQALREQFQGEQIDLYDLFLYARDKQCSNNMAAVAAETAFSDLLSKYYDCARATGTAAKRWVDATRYWLDGHAPPEKATSKSLKGGPMTSALALPQRQGGRIVMLGPDDARQQLEDDNAYLQAKVLTTQVQTYISVVLAFSKMTVAESAVARGQAAIENLDRRASRLELTLRAADEAVGVINDAARDVMARIDSGDLVIGAAGAAAGAAGAGPAALMDYEDNDDDGQDGPVLSPLPRMDIEDADPCFWGDDTHWGDEFLVDASTLAPYDPEDEQPDAMLASDRAALASVSRLRDHADVAIERAVSSPLESADDLLGMAFDAQEIRDRVAAELTETTARAKELTAQVESELSMATQLRERVGVGAIGGLASAEEMESRAARLESFRERLRSSVKRREDGRRDLVMSLMFDGATPPVMPTNLGNQASRKRVRFDPTREDDEEADSSTGTAPRESTPPAAKRAKSVDGSPTAVEPAPTAGSAPMETDEVIPESDCESDSESETAGEPTAQPSPRRLRRRLTATRVRPLTQERSPPPKKLSRPRIVPATKAPTPFKPAQAQKAIGRRSRLRGFPANFMANEPMLAAEKAALWAQQQAAARKQ